MGTSPLQLGLTRSLGTPSQQLGTPSQQLVGSLSTGLVVLLALSSFAVAQERAGEVKAPEEIARPSVGTRHAFGMVGTNTCSSVACHGSQQTELGRPRVREAYLNWAEFDPHGRTRELLYGEKYKMILDRLEAGGHVRMEMARRCAKCHDPGAMPGDVAGTASYQGTGEGVGCESCHGNAEKWLTRHYERGVTPSELLSLGKITTKSPIQRAAACVKCHVGSADHDMNHDMIGAGHPVLRFELAAYHDLIKFKHWNDGPERYEAHDYQVQLWAAGQTASAKARLELLASRTADNKPGESKPAAWPEFAEFNCYSCHQKIRAGDVLAKEPNSSGLPGWNRWNLTFAGGLNTNAANQPNAAGLSKLYELPFVTPRQDARTAVAAVNAGVLSAHEPLDTRQLLAKLTFTLGAGGDVAKDWETRSQQYLALVAAERSYRDELTKVYYRSLLSRSDYDRLMADEKPVIEALEKVRKSLVFESDKLKTVLIDEPLEFRQNQDSLGGALLDIARSLQERVQPKP